MNTRIKHLPTGRIFANRQNAKYQMGPLPTTRHCMRDRYCSLRPIVRPTLSSNLSLKTHFANYEVL